MKKILLLFGGNSSEHYVSCLSAKSIVENIDKNIYELTIVGINKNYWYIFDDELSYLEKGNWLSSKNIIKIHNIIDFLMKFDIVFPIIHGNDGEDGKIQGMLELFNIKYVGSNTLSSAIGMDKEMSKILFNHLNIPVVPYICLKNNNYNINHIIKKLNFPMVVKPANGGSSIGISKVANKKELIIGIKEAQKYDQKVIIEQFIKARELECSIIEDKKIYISTIGEIKPANSFYDYNSKYENNIEQSIVPAKLPKKIIKQIKFYAKEIFLNIGARGLSRIDFFYDEQTNKVYINEINTLPGFTTISMYPKLLIHDKISYQNIITKLLENAKK